MKNDSLRIRHEGEKDFHDEKYKHGGPRKDFYSIGYKSIVFDNFLMRIGDIRGKNVLEYGCGTGWLTRILARMGANVWSFDISLEAAARARNLNVESGYGDSVHINVMAAEELGYAGDVFDVVLGNAILHHLKQDSWIPDLHRVMKKGGKALFMEPLAHNPAINLFRLLTPHRRSVDEKPLNYRDVKKLGEHFEKLEHQEFYLFALLALVFYPFGLKSATLKARDFLHKFDVQFQELAPFTSKFCWYTVIELTK